MSIDKTIEFFNSLECCTPQAKDARDVAIKTMLEYQRIEHIIKSDITALRVYNATLDECTCGNCLGYINKGYNYCPQCGCKLED